MTKNAAQISINSLKARYYSPDPGAKRSIKKTAANTCGVYRRNIYLFGNDPFKWLRDEKEKSLIFVILLIT